MNGGRDQLTSWREDDGGAASDAAARGVRARMTSAMARRAAGTGEAAATSTERSAALAGAATLADCGECCEGTQSTERGAPSVARF